MSNRVRARFANGVLTPLEPLDLEEGTVVVLNIEAAHATDSYGARVYNSMSDIKKEMKRICQLPEGDPKKYKLFLDAEDVYIYLDKEIRYMEPHG